MKPIPRLTVIYSLRYNKKGVNKGKIGTKDSWGTVFRGGYYGKQSTRSE